MKSLLSGARSFRTAEAGNVVFMFALVTIPMIGLVGASVDYSRANSARTAMQAAVDSTALMLSKDVAALDSGQIATKANDYFNSLYKYSDIAGIKITPTYTGGIGGEL